jgi:hypothetical protein
MCFKSEAMVANGSRERQPPQYRGSKIEDRESPVRDDAIIDHRFSIIDPQ